MAEAIGLAASVTGLVSLGLSVCKGLAAYYDTYQSAENDVKRLCEEVNNLSLILQSFEDALKDSEMRLKLEASASTRPINVCMERIRELDKELQKLMSSGMDEKRSARKFMSKTMKALYPFKEETLQKLRSNISRTNEMLQQVASTVLIRQNHKMHDAINQFYEKGESREIMRWLDPPDPSHSHAVASSKRGEETGSWFINSSEFSSWKSSPYSVLWVYGSAGRGKTVLCSTIINHLLQHCENKPTSGIAYFYFDYTNASISQHHNRLLRSLIEQLSSQNGAIPKSLKTLYERCRHGTTQPTEAELTQTLRNIIQLFSPCYLVIDAVDESKEKQEFLKLLSVIAGQWRLPQIHFLVTSRTELDTEIPKRTWQGATMSIQDGIAGDVESQILSTLRDENGALSQWDPDQREMIAKSLIDNSRGNFRWVACQLQALEDCHTAQELDEALESLPATLEETYERSLLAIEEKRREGFRHVLRWLSFSARPMHLDEITEVLAIDFSVKPRPQYDPRKRLVNSVKFFHKHSNLVSVSTVKNRARQHQQLRLAHLSVRDYLLSNKIVGSPASFFTINSLSAHRSIAEACIVYLQQFTKSDEELEKSPKNHSLAPYAARFWSYHVQAATAAAGKERSSSSRALLETTNPEAVPLIILIIELLAQILRVFGFPIPTTEKAIQTDLNSLCVELLSAQLEGQIRFFDPDTPWIDKPDVSRQINALPSGLYYAANSGLTDSVRLLLAKGMDVNAIGGRHGTALQAASCRGYKDIVQLLLENGAKVDQLAGDYGYALQGAACYGHEECVKLLLEWKADVNAKGGAHHTALHAAAFNGYEKIVEILVERGAAINDPGSEERGQSPLIEAAAEGQTATVQLLLKLGADILMRDQGGWTALDESAPPGFDAVVRILIDHDPAILQSRDKSGKSALHHTVGQGHISTVSLLLERGVDVNVIDAEGRSALFGAVRSGNKAIVELLLKHGANPLVKDETGWSILHMAAFYGHVEVGEVLIEAGTPINQGPEGISPLHIAVLRKQASFLEMLLDHRADPQAETESGADAMYFLELNETYEADAVAQRLSIDINALTVTGLRIAASEGRDARIRELLERGANINARDEGGHTALTWAAMKGHTSTMRLLIENGADVNACTDDGRTVMDWFYGMDEDIVNLLWEYGYKEEKQSVDLDGGDLDGRAPLDTVEREVLNNIRKLLLR
ncbi:NACHT domain-containing protein [Fusarium sp. LHS14.1]|nr:NACHT domain-containing protein [Fusarium sp. LHS14.1]